MSRDVGAYEYLLLVMGALGYGCHAFIWLSVPAFLSVIIEEFGISTTQAGLLVGAIPLVYVPLGLVSGLVIDRVGSRVTIGAGLVLFGAVQVARGVVESFAALFALTLLIGVAATTMTFGLPKLVAELFPPERTGSLSSVYQLGAQLGAVAAFALARPVLGPFFGGWRPAFVAMGSVVFVYALVWLAVSTVYARMHGGQWETQDKARSEQDRGFTLDSIRDDLARLLSHRDMLLLVVIGTMQLIISHALQGWLPVFLERGGHTATLAGLTTSLLIVAQISGSVTIPFFSDRWGRRRAALVSSGVLCTFGTAGLIVASDSLPAVVAAVWAVGMGLGGLIILSKVIPIEIEAIGPGLSATAVSLIYTVGQAGGFVSPVLIGALEDATGTFEAGFAILVVAAVGIIVAGREMTSLE